MCEETDVITFSQLTVKNEIALNIYEVIFLVRAYLEDDHRIFEYFSLFSFFSFVENL